MHLLLLLSSVYLATIVVAGGFQGALERVLLYYAYQIDGLNDPSYRQLGFSCVSWDTPKKECKDDNWAEYRCTAFDDPKKPGSKRCNFWQFMTNLGETHGGNNGHLMMPEGTDINAKTLPIEKTAVSYYMYISKYTTFTDREGRRGKGKVSDYQPYRFAKHTGTDYSEWLELLGDIVKNAARSHKNSSNKWLFEQFERTLEQLRVARIGDNGRHVVDAYKKDSTLEDKYMVTESPGTNPATKPEYENLSWFDTHKGEWTELNWAKTQDKMEKAGVSDAGKKIRDFQEGFMKIETAKEHQAVMNEFELMESKIKGCR